MQLIDAIVRSHDHFTALRRDIHAHPELRFEEVRTADLVAEQLSAWGIPMHRGLGTTGVVGILQHGYSSRAIGLRADMDALPMQELNTFAHASKAPGKMHACGHDGHTAMLLQAARHLSEHRNFDGTVYLIFQPAEEGGGGAREMIKEGLFRQFPMDAVFGLHNLPGAAVGNFAVSTGPVMASSNEFKITLHGKGGHAAMPHLALDPVPVACQLVQSFQTIVSRNTKPLDAAVVSITMIHAGEATNVIPDTCELQGTVRTFSLEVLDLVEERMRQMTEHISQASGLGADFEFVRNYPPTINSVRESEFARQVIAGIVGPEHVLVQEPSMGSEDFSYMLQEVPGSYVCISNGDGDHRALGHGLGPCTLHNTSYDFNDDLLPLGATYWVRLVEAWLNPVASTI